MRQREVDKLVRQVGDFSFARHGKTRRIKTPLKARVRDERLRQAIAAAETADEKRLNWSERQFLQKAVGKSARVLRNGWPDFLVQRDGKTIAVEVKRGADDLSDTQIRMFDALGLVGIPVYVWNPRRPSVLVPWHKYHPLPGAKRETGHAGQPDKTSDATGTAK